jgi:hypothetical protein
MYPTVGAITAGMYKHDKRRNNFHTKSLVMPILVCVLNCHCSVLKTLKHLQYAWSRLYFQFKKKTPALTNKKLLVYVPLFRNAFIEMFPKRLTHERGNSKFSKHALQYKSKAGLIQTGRHFKSCA